MKFNLAVILMGKPIISGIEKDEKSNRIKVELDRFGNKSTLSFDKICFQSFIEALGDYFEKGGLFYSPSESCQGQTDLDVFSLDLSEEKKFSVRLDLGSGRGNCGLFLRSGNTQISFCFNEAQINKIVDKFKSAVNSKKALVEAEKEVEL